MSTLRMPRITMCQTTRTPILPQTGRQRQAVLRGVT
jgi:hypothetical protein